MLKARPFLASAALALFAAGCGGSPVSAERTNSATPSFDGQTLGSGHRGEYTPATVADATMADDSGSTAERGGQTLGSGH